MLKCFNESLRIDQVDREAFRFGHNLLGHPALSLENLARVLPALPQPNVMYSKGLLMNGDDFESTFRKRPEDRSLEQTIEEIRTGNSYIMVKSPELAPSFQSLYQDLLADVNSIVRERRISREAIDPQLYLFIASPDSVTPFHIDRNSTFLMQFRGTKHVHVFPQWDERVVSAPDTELYMAYTSTKLPWSSAIDAMGTDFEFKPGEALHIPFVAGHHVRNGSDDVSISMSIIFNTDENLEWKNALAFNHSLRKVMGRVGAKPNAVGSSPKMDAAKARMYRGLTAMR